MNEWRNGHAKGGFLAVAATVAGWTLAAIAADMPTNQACPAQDFDINVPTIRCPALAVPPSIDGRIEEAEWGGAQRIPALWTYGDDDSGVPEITVFLGWTPTNLYLAFRCGQPALALAPPGEKVKRDLVEFVLDGRKSGGKLFHFAADAGSNLVARRWEEADSGAWREQPVRAAEGSRLGFRTIEMDMPLALLGLDDAVTKRSIRANFRRVQVRSVRSLLQLPGIERPVIVDETFHKTWIAGSDFLEPESGSGRLTFTDKPTAYFPFPEGNLASDGLFSVNFRAYATDAFQGRLMILIRHEDKPDQVHTSTVNFAKGTENKCYTRPTLPFTGEYILSLAALDNAGNILYQTPPVAPHSGKLRISGLLPAYYNDEEAAQVQILFHMPPEEAARILGQEYRDEKGGIATKTSRHFLHMTMRPIDLKDGVETGSVARLTEERSYCFFSRSMAPFGLPGHASMWRIRGLPEGQYGLKVRLLYSSMFDIASWQQGGKTKGQKLNTEYELPEQTFFILPPPTAATPEAAAHLGIGPEGEFRLNGKLFVPLSLYHIEPRDYGLAQRLGFNFMGIGKSLDTRQMIESADAAWACGLYSSFGMNRPGEGHVYFHEEFLARVKAVANHPGTLFLLQPDEVLGYGGGNTNLIAPARRFYEAARQADTNHLIYVTTTSGPALHANGRAVLNTTCTFCDVVALDNYSIGKRPIYHYFHAADLVDSVVRPAGKTQLFVAQSNDSMSPITMPTPAELRAQALLAMMGGVKGLAWYVYYGNLLPEAGLREYPIGWAYMKKLNRDLTTLSPALAGKRSRDVRVFPAEGVVAVRMRTEAADYIFVANVDFMPKTLAIEYPGLPSNSPVAAAGEYRTLLSSDGGWADDFAPYAVHVYVPAVSK
jgi:hypothetical protein